MGATRFHGNGKTSLHFYEVGADYIARKRTFGTERMGVPQDEARWAINLTRAQDLFLWHRNHGLERRERHPMGKDLAELKRQKSAAEAKRYTDSGMEPPGYCLAPTNPTKEG